MKSSVLKFLAAFLLIVGVTACDMPFKGGPTAPTSPGSDASITYVVLGSPLNGVLGTATVAYATPTGTVVATAVSLANGVPFVSPTTFSFGQFAGVTPGVSVTVNGCAIVQILSNAQVVATSDKAGENCGLPANRSVTLK